MVSTSAVVLLVSFMLPLELVFTPEAFSAGAGRRVGSRLGVDTETAAGASVDISGPGALFEAAAWLLSNKERSVPNLVNDQRLMILQLKSD